MPRIAITAPYPEGAIMKLAAKWQSDGHLAVAMLPSRAVNRAAAKMIAPFQPDLASRLTRNSLPGHVIEEVAPEVETLRLLSKISSMPEAFITAHSLGKIVFDRFVANHADLGDARLFVGMSEASLYSFQRFKDVTRVLHQVDAHPRYHNEALWEVYGKRQTRHETYSEARTEWMLSELEAADKILVPSQDMKSQMTSRGIAEEKLIHVPYGVDFEKFSITREAGAVKLASSDRSRPKVMYIGQIALRKGIPFLIEAAKKSGVALDLIGPLVPGKPLPSLPDNVRYLGTLPHEKLAVHLSVADAFVFPSLEDSFAFTPVEAAATGLPIIMTRDVGAGELFDESEVRWIRKADVDDLADALGEVTLLSEDERADRANRVRTGEICRVMSWSDYGDAVYDALAPLAR